MRFEVGPPNDVERVTRLDLVKRDGEADVIAVEDDCAEAYLLTFTKAGRILRTCNICPALGFDLDEQGRIKWEEE